MSWLTTSRETLAAECDEVAQFSSAVLTPAFLQDFNAAGKPYSLSRLMLLAWCAHRRAERGEYLHAQLYLGDAVDVLLRLLSEHNASDGPRGVGCHSLRRRLERRNPALARELLAIILGTVNLPDVRLLEVCEQHLRPHAPELCWTELMKLRDWLLDMPHGMRTAPVV